MSVPINLISLTLGTITINDLLPSIIEASATIIAALSVVIITKKYQEHSKKMQDDQMEVSLFSEFNKRYDSLNDTLKNIKYITCDEELKDYPPESIERIESCIILHRPWIFH